MYTFRPWDEPTDAERALGKYTDSIDMALPGNNSESAIYYRSKIKPTPGVYHADGDKDLMFYVLRRIQQCGLVLEFGTWRAHSINYIAGQCPNRQIHGFDVFNTDNTSFKDGKDWNGHDFTQAQLPLVKSNVTLHPGWFHLTLPVFVKENNESCALLHVDCDNYDGASDVFEWVKLTPGSIVVFDEYLNVPNWKDNEYKAWQEYCKKNNVRYKYIAVNTKHQQVAVIIT